MSRPQWLDKYPLAVVCLLLGNAVCQADGPTDGILWLDGHVFPRFAAPAKQLDTLNLHDLTPDEQLTFSALAGQVNRRQPRIALVSSRNEEAEKWFRTPTVNLSIGNRFDQSDKYTLLAKYAEEVRGLVLYDPTRNPHLRNLAATVAAIEHALPVTREVAAAIKSSGVEAKVIADLSTLDFATPIEVYEHLYDNYWSKCEKRFLLSARPDDHGGDFHHTRDLAAACGAAAVWLDCREPAERKLFGKFLADMPVGNSAVLGWYTTERSGVTTATEYGVGTMAADHFTNATLFAAGNPEIRIPTPPACPAVENKLYVAVFISDGDNIQYVQNAMRRIWDHSAAVRGQQPLNWTMAPGLVDIAPGILNYYYDTATPLDCFVCGPSGMGYLMPFNTLAEPGAPVGNKLDDPRRMEAYAQLTNRYLRRAGLKVVTIWDDATPSQRQAYEQHCPDLLGATVQNFRDVPSVQSSWENNRLRVERLQIPYADNAESLSRSLTALHAKHDQSAPEFAAYQVNIWKLQPERLVAWMTKIQRELPQVEFVRADHFFQLQALGSADTR